MTQQEIRGFIGKLPQNEKDNLLAYAFADIQANVFELDSTASVIESYLKKNGKDNFDAIPVSRVEPEEESEEIEPEG